MDWPRQCNAGSGFIAHAADLASLEAVLNAMAGQQHGWLHGARCIRKLCYAAIVQVSMCDVAVQWVVWCKSEK